MGRRKRKAPRTSAGTGRKRGGPGAAEAQRRRGMWIMVGCIAAGLLGVSIMANLSRSGSPHPTPRAAVDQPDVISAARYADFPRVVRAYELAAAVPMILDGLYCHCHCSEHSDHYSLLDCFASDHAARCDVCMSEAVIGHDMSRDGASLDEIRAQIDRTYGT